MTTIIIIGAILLILAFYFITVYNKLVRLKTMVQEAWSSIDVMLKKRHDLIPNLVETVKGYASHEKETLQGVINARNQAISAKSVKDHETAENNLNRSLVNLFALAEQYPDLKANANFLELQGELANIEGDIEKSRRYYNGTVRDNNILIDSFPSNIVAGMFSFVKAVFFELVNPGEERAVPKVSFS